MDYYLITTMINFFKKNKFNMIRFMLIIPIILVSIISISHVTIWYNLSNPLSWALYLSVAIEIAAMVAVMAASLKMKGGAWWIFIIVSFIQFIGNIFYSYNEINVNSPEFKSWVELVSPIFDIVGLDSSDVLSHKRWLTLLEGGLLPIISLTCLHFFIKYSGVDESNPTPEVIEETIVNEDKEEFYVVENTEDEEVKPFKEEDLIPYEETGDESEGVYFEPDTSPKEEVEEVVIEPEILEEEPIIESPQIEEEKKNNDDSITDNGSGGLPTEESVNNSKIQMGSSKSGESIIYKNRGLRN